jgi:hypothetical protein
MHTHSEQWQHFEPVFLPVAVGKMELTWVQNDTVGLKNILTAKV